MEVPYCDGKKVLWEVVDDNIVDQGKEHDEIGIWGLDLIVFTEKRRGWLEKA